MKKIFTVILTLCLTFSMFSCKNGGGVFTPTSSGRAYELLVVIDQTTWKEPAGRALYDVLDTDVPGLPQAERSFRIMYTDPRDFDSTLKLIRNIVIADISPRYTKCSFKAAHDVYAFPQLILNIQAPDKASFEAFVSENSRQIVDIFTRAEMNRQIVLLEKKHNDYISTVVDEMFQSEIWLPADLSSSKKGEDFFWASSNTATSNQNFVIYSYPYRDVETFTEQYIIHKRDSVMKANIPGARKGMYMSTDSQHVISRPINVQGEYAYELRGLWRMKGDFMGGPFVSHTRLDKKNQRIVTVEIFVYAPEKMKRNLVRILESSLYTLRLPEQILFNDTIVRQ